MSTDTERAPWKTPAGRAEPMTDLDEQVVCGGPEDFMTVRRLRIRGTNFGRGLRNGGAVMAALAGVVACIVTVKRFKRWGATSEEVSRALPGDAEVALPSLASTRAITIHAPADAVWPWLVQMGWRRAGYYSYNAIDNDHVPSADHIIPALQDLHVGDFVPEGQNVGWTVKALEPGHLLLLTTHGPMAGVDWLESRDSSWLFLVEAVDAEHSRLIERERTAVKVNYRTLLGALATRFAVSGLYVGDFVMAHRHMKGIKARAERVGAVPEAARD